MNNELIGYCGVDCSVCADFLDNKCLCCRKSTWMDEDECHPISCCKEKNISYCGECSEFSCKIMSDFYKESESHYKAYERMKQINCSLSGN